MELFQLVGSVLVDNSKANESLSKTDKQASDLGKTLAAGAATAGKFALGLGTAAAGVGIAATKMATDAAKAMDTIDKGSIRMGVSAEYYQELAYAAGQSGVEMSTMERAAKALEGTDLNLDDAMEQIMSITDAEERAAAAADLFGETTAYKMAPLLEAGGEGFDQLRERANELGLVIDGETVKAGVKLGDTMSDVQQAFGMIVTQIGAELLPVIQNLLDWVLEHMPEIQSAIQTVTDVIGTILEHVGEVIGWLAGKFDEHFPQIEAAVGTSFQAIGNFWTDELQPIFEEIGTFIMETLWPAFQTVFEQYIGPAVKTAFEVAGQVWDTILKPTLTGIIDFLDGVFKGDWEKAFNALSGIVESVFNGMVELVKKPLNTIIGYINSFFASIGEIDVPDWVPFIGGETFSLPQIPLLAKGGNVLGAGSAIVGEAGAELVELPAGARVTPLGSGGSGDLEQKLDRMLALMERYMPQQGGDIYMDSHLVGQVINETLGAAL